MEIKMNERIQKLALQAGLEFDNDLALEPEPIYYTTQKDLEKFAELIVKECTDIVKPTSHHEVWAQSYLGGVDGLDLLHSKIKDIKKHFGVEE